MDPNSRLSEDDMSFLFGEDWTNMRTPTRPGFIRDGYAYADGADSSWAVNASGLGGEQAPPGSPRPGSRVSLACYKAEENWQPGPNASMGSRMPRTRPISFSSSYGLANQFLEPSTSMESVNGRWGDAVVPDWSLPQGVSDRSSATSSPPVDSKTLGRMEQGKVVLVECQKALLDLQGERLKRAQDQNLGGYVAIVIPCILPSCFSRDELENLLDFNGAQFKAMQEFVKALTDPEKRVESEDWATARLGQGLNGGWRHGVVNVIMPMMNAWETTAAQIHKFLRGSIATANYTDSPLFEQLLRLLEQLKNDIATVQVCWDSVDLAIKNKSIAAPVGRKTLKESNGIRGTVPVLNAFRAEDPVELPSVRFPRSRKQHCAPRYASGAPKFRR